MIDDDKKKEIVAPPPEAATAVLSENSDLTIKEHTISKDELIGEYARRLSFVMPVVKKMTKNQLIRILANTLAPPWLLPLKNYKLKDEFEQRVSRHIGMVMDAQIAYAEWVAKEMMALEETEAAPVVTESGIEEETTPE